MRVAQIFKQAGFEVSQSRRYVDPESGEIREIDVVASVNRQIGAIAVSITLFIECKYSFKKPWVIFTAPRNLDPFFYFSRILHEKYDVYEWKTQESLQGRLLARILFSLGHGSISQSTFFAMPRNVGYNMVESFRDPKEKGLAYTAMMQVNNCTQAHDIDIERGFQETIQDYYNAIEAGVGKAKFSFFCSIAFPIIVVRGNLFECYLNPNNEVDISEIDDSMILVSNKNLGEESKKQPCTSAIRIVTESRVEALAKEAYQAASMLILQDAAVHELWEHECLKLGKSRIEETPF
jgi:hypothetical protein